MDDFATRESARNNILKEIIKAKNARQTAEIALETAKKEEQDALSSYFKTFGADIKVGGSSFQIRFRGTTPYIVPTKEKKAKAAE